MVATEHVALSRTVFVPPPGKLTSQHPKQSQPLGVFGLQ
jgi:hypothetical protein